MLGLVVTAISFVRSSKWAVYALIAVAAVGILVLSLSRFGAKKKREGAAEVIAATAVKMIERMERNRQIHAEIKRLPLSERAARLRALDRRKGDGE